MTAFSSNPDLKVLPGKKVLLAWEFGAGRTHILNLLGVARHLREAGIECAATLYETQFAPEFAALDIPVVQNYLWPARRRKALPWDERPASTLGDTLANLGVADPQSLNDAIRHYEGLFALFKPDLVLCENAFGAILAARNHIPAIALGTSSCLPPVNGTSFPPRAHAAGAPSWPESEVLDGINTGLKDAGRQPLPTLTDLLRQIETFPFGPSAFDAYREHRDAPVLPTLIPDLPDVPSEGDEIFVYLHGFVQHNAEFMQTLASIDRPMRVYIPGLEEPHQQALRSQGISVETTPVAVADIVRRSRCVVHHGGHQLTTICLAKAIPQVLLSRETDNQLAGDFLRNEGLGFEEHITRASAEWMINAARAAFDSAEIAEKCRAKAPQINAWFDLDPTRIVAEATMRKLESPQQ